MSKTLIKTTFSLIFIILLSACNDQIEIENENKEKVDNLILLFTEFRQNIEKFNFEEVDNLYVEINLLLKDDTYNEDRIVLEGYLNSLYSVRDEGVVPYQQFLKELPESYDGILSELLWEDYNKVIRNGNL